jgi:hypothetical protein
MGRSIEVEGIWIHTNIIPCANRCGYCQVGRKKIWNIRFSRVAALLDRFTQWKEERGLQDFQVGHWVGYTHDFSLSDLLEVKRLYNRKDWSLELILLGGLPDRSKDKLKGWLRERQEAGFTSVVASFMGYGEFHDRWNGRRGDFERLMETQRIAADLGMDLQQRIFLTRGTIPMLDGLLEKLDELPGKVIVREAYPLFYSGKAVKLEKERITEETLNSLPEHIKKLYRSDWKNWQSERQWIKTVMGEAETPEKLSVSLILNESNIDRYESMSCEAILAELESRTRDAYSAIPGRRELCEQCGDASNTRIYMFRHDIERKWLDTFLRKTPVEFEREMTHLS